MFLFFWMIIQVIGESLPISSSGHVALMHALSTKFHILLPASIELNAWAFDYLLQGISAILFFVYFFSAWWKLLINRPIRLHALCELSVWKRIVGQVFLFGIAADGVTFLCWAVKIDQLVHLPLAIGFIITAVALWSTQFAKDKKNINIWSVSNGLVVGFVQGCALLPGISRFGTTFAALRWLGYRNDDALSISFLIQWPLIVAGSLLGCKELYDTGVLTEILSFPLLISMMLSSVAAYGVLVWVHKIIDKNLLWKFSYYMVIPILLALCV